jgi:DNA-binding MarR family transcriptional regulator
MHIHMTMPKQIAPPPTLTRDARAALETCAGLHARLVARRLSRLFDRHLAPFGLGLAQFGLMAEIAAAADDTIGGLAARAGLDPSTLSRNLRALERQGLVEIVIAEADLRRRAVWLTEKGARTLASAMPAWREAQVELAALIDPAVLARLAAETTALDAA